MGTRLRDMIRAVRACKTAAEERAVIAKECAALRNAFKDEEGDTRHRNVAKLMFIHMLGYPTHFGQMECLKLIAAPSFPEKRIGYLGLMILLDERQEVLMLVTNSIKNDLNHANQFIVGLALCSLGNICSAEMARDLAPEVEKLLSSSNSYIRKKAALCSIRIVRKVPELIEYVLGPATGLLNDKHHGVLIAGVSLAIELAQTSSEALAHFRKQTPTLVRILKNLVISGYAPEYDVGGITDPFLQVRVLRLLRLVGKGDTEASDIMSDILAQVATNTESAKNSGNAILYECVMTIMGVEAIGGLRVLAINILGRFLANRDNNIRYVALNTLVNVVSVDTQAVQRHRATIVECVKDSDVSIRRRALELVYALVNENNIKTLTKELLDYLKVSDPEFKPDLTAKICSLVHKFAPNKLWHIDTMIRVMSEAGSFVKDDWVRVLIVLISNAPELQGYTVRSFYRAFQDTKNQESLTVTAVWCIGEYGEMLINHANELEGEEPLTVTEQDVVDVLEGVLKDSPSTSVVRGFALTALLKLTSRYTTASARIKGLIEHYRGSLVVELQQRAIEYGKILDKHENIKPQLLERMPAVDEAHLARRTGVDENLVTADKEARSPKALANGAKPVQAAANLMDLLDLSVDDTPAPPPAAAADALADLLGSPVATRPSPPAQPSGANMLLDLLAEPAPSTAPPAATPPAPFQDPLAALMGGPAAPVSQPPAALDPFGDLLGGGAPAAGPSFPSIVAFEKDGLRINFDFSKPAANSQQTTIKATYTNSGPAPFTDFVFQAAVPKFMTLSLEPASGSVVPASQAGSLTQTINVTNSLHGQKNLVMRLRISYKVNGSEVLEQGQVSNFPPQL